MERRPPHGGRGLKCAGTGNKAEGAESPPTRGARIEIGPAWPRSWCQKVAPHMGAWIEISHRQGEQSIEGQSPPAWGAWVKVVREREDREVVMSPPTRGAWIEIPGRMRRLRWTRLCRPPHGGRGLKSLDSRCCAAAPGRRPPPGGRGLKYVLPDALFVGGVSPPAWGAWIEI